MEVRQKWIYENMAGAKKNNHEGQFQRV